MIKQNKILSAYAIERGGVLAGAAKCAMGNKLGVDFTETNLQELTKKYYGAIMVEAESINDGDFKLIGKVSGIPMVTIGGENIIMDDIAKAFTGALESVYPTHAKAEGIMATNIYTKKDIYVCKHKFAQPMVTIPVFRVLTVNTILQKLLKELGHRLMYLL